MRNRMFWLPILLILLVFSIVQATSDWEDDDLSFSTGSTKIVKAHREASCNDCHQMVASFDADMPNKDFLGRKCLDCHASRTVSTSILAEYFHLDKSRACIDCHSFHETDQLTAQGKSFVFDYSETRRFQCISCHNKSGNIQSVSKGHRAVLGKFHENTELSKFSSPSTKCLQCHANQSSSKTHEGEVVTAIHINSSASHVVGVPVRIKGDDGSKAFNQQELSLFEGKMECQTCHRLNAGTKYCLVRFEQDYDLCWSCHSQGRNAFSDR